METKRKVGRPLKAVDATVLRAERARGISVGELAQKYNLSKATVWRRLQEPPAITLNTTTVPGLPSEGVFVYNADAAPKAASESELLFKDKYTYNAATDTYITFLKTAPDPVVLTGDTHRAMLRAYSNFNGNPSSVNEICRQFGFPRQWLTEYLKAHGITHDMEPFSAEELLNKPMPELVADALQMKRQQFFQEHAKADWKDTEKAAYSWYNLETSFKIPMEEFIRENMPKYKVPKLDIPKGNFRFSAVFSAADVHYGKGSWHDETGFSYSRQECTQLLHRHTTNLAAQIARFGKPDRIFVAVGNDWFHIDNSHGTTTAGTAQDLDGSPHQILKEGLELAIEHVDMIRQIGPVTLVMSDGNHDRDRSFMLLMFLSAFYRNVEDVDVIVSAQPRQYVKYGSTLMGFYHGDAVHPRDLGAVMATEAREDWGLTSNRAFFTGHLHHEVTREIGGITHYQMPSLSPADRWHSRKGYVTSRRAMTAYVVSHEDGVIASLVSPVKEEMAYGVKMPNRARML